VSPARTTTVSFFNPRVTMLSTLFSAATPTVATDVATQLGLAGASCETTSVGGNTPPWLVTRAAEDIARGELDATLIVGAQLASQYDLSICLWPGLLRARDPLSGLFANDRLPDGTWSDALDVTAGGPGVGFAALAVVVGVALASMPGVPRPALSPLPTIQ
jgi:acetyl-CoA acetyltransferase